MIIMRKLIITVLAALSTTLSYGQTIGYRNESNNSLTIGTNYSVMGRELGVSLNYYLNKSTKEERWLLCFILYSRNEPLSIDQGAELLIRTFSGTVIELKQNDNCYDIKRERDYPYQASGNYNVIDYLVYPGYFIDGKSVQILMKEGIQKMRFETTKGIRDLKWNKDVYGGIITSEYNLVLGKSDFGADF